MITRQVIDLSTKLPHFPTTHVYIGLLLFFIPQNLAPHVTIYTIISVSAFKF